LCLHNADYFSWEWQDENKRWNPYNVQTSVSLEKARVAGEQDVTFEAFKRAYTVNINKMEQVNDDTGVVRKVQRVKSCKY
jgi:hypothetical protein